MVAISYENLGSISGVTTNPRKPASHRSRDRNNIQRLAFKANSNRPFTGIIHVGGCIGDPTRSEAEAVWFDIAEMIIDNEGGSWSYEPLGEFSSLRVECREGNYWTAAHGIVNGTVGVGGGDFTIDGISISVNGGDTAAVVASTINNDANIIANGTIVADVVKNSALRIYKTDGTNLVLADTTNTPLEDLGITPGTFQPGIIESIQLLR